MDAVSHHGQPMYGKKLTLSLKVNFSFACGEIVFKSIHKKLMSFQFWVQNYLLMCSICSQIIFIVFSRFALVLLISEAFSQKLLSG